MCACVITDLGSHGDVGGLLDLGLNLLGQHGGQVSSVGVGAVAHHDDSASIRQVVDDDLPVVSKEDEQNYQTCGARGEGRQTRQGVVRLSVVVAGGTYVNSGKCHPYHSRTRMA